MTFAPSNAFSSYLAEDFDIPTDPVKQRDFLNKRERLTASILNIKSNGNYEQRELINADTWFTSLIDNALIPKIGFRFTFNLVQIFGAPIPAGVTVINLGAVVPPYRPISIQGITHPLPSYGSATIPGPIYVFTGTDFNVTFDNTAPAAQLITITNNTGQPFSQCFWVLNYLKQLL